jgi:DNA modification methylase
VWRIAYFPQQSAIRHAQEAARQLGMKKVPLIRLRGLSPAAKSALRLADNKIAENAGWDLDFLAHELQILSGLDLDFDLTVTGFDEADIDVMLQAGVASSEAGGADEIPEVDRSLPPVTRLGDMWILGKKGHRAYCGDARKRKSFEILIGDHKATMVISDVPYNVVINGNVSGLGRTQHREFAMASGEMSSSQFTSFLGRVMGLLAQHTLDGSIHFLFMDWRHIYEITVAGRSVYTELKNVVVWNKSNGGMGSFYRSKHELVFVFKSGTAPHVNNIELGKHGRNRTNVWDYAGMNTMREGRLEELAMHPTVKPVALVADAIMDCSRRGDIVLDRFGGSGTTLIAAEQTGRVAYLMEIDPIYVDVTIRRFQKFCAFDLSCCITDRDDSDGRSELGSIPAARLFFPRRRPATFQDAAECGETARKIFGTNKEIHLSPNCFFGAVTERLFRGRIPARDLRLGGEADDGIGRCLDDGGEQRCLALNALALGDVPDGDRHH